MIEQFLGALPFIFFIAWVVIAGAHVTRGFGGVLRAGIFTAIMVLCAFFNWVSDYNAANAGRPGQGDWGPEKVAGWTVAIFGIWAAWGWWKDIRGD